MQIMKTLKNIMMALLLTVSGTAMADDYAYLTIDQTGGETSFAVSNIAKITFDANNMVLHLTDGTQTTLPLAQLSKMFFADKDATGIATIGTQQSGISIKDGVLRVSAEQGATVAIYDAGGRAVRMLKAGEKETEVNLNGMVKGVYIVKVGTQTKKVMNK
jgi:hypothetical protein